MATKRIGILTSGGDCPGLNAVIRGAVKSCHQLGYDCVGFLKGYEGLYDPVQYVHLTPKSTRGILNQGGTILGSTNKGRFAATVGVSDRQELAPDLVAGVKETISQLGIDGLICVGGDGSLAVAQQFHENGIPVVGVPKTIDNDLSATAFTFGFDSAIECATDALDRLHTTAASHERIMVLEVMGRHAGWIALHSGIAGGGDIILIPEIEWDYEYVCHKILHRESHGKKFTLVVVAEGAHLPGGDLIGEQRDGQQMKLGGVGRAVAEEIERRLHRETRLSVLGHLQRGGQPTTFDRVLATEFGAHAVRLVKEKRFGEMICSRPPEMTSVPIIEAVNVLRRVDPHGPAVQAARALGISFGDRPADEIGQDVFDKVEMSKPRVAQPAQEVASSEAVQEPVAPPEPTVEAEPTVASIAEQRSAEPHPPAAEPTATEIETETTVDPIDDIAATALELTVEVGSLVEERETESDVETVLTEAAGVEAAGVAAEEPPTATKEEAASTEEHAAALEVDEVTETETPAAPPADDFELPAETEPVSEAPAELEDKPRAAATDPAPAEAEPPVPAVEETAPAEATKADIAERIRERLANAAKSVASSEKPSAEEPAPVESAEGDEHPQAAASQGESSAPSETPAEEPPVETKAAEQPAETKPIEKAPEPEADPIAEARTALEEALGANA